MVRRHARGGQIHVHSETFREMLVWGEFLQFRVDTLPQRCRGSFFDEGADVYKHLDPVMERLGFAQPLPTGPFCRLYERDDAAMACTSTPSDEPESVTICDFELWPDLDVGGRLKVPTLSFALGLTQPSR
ncbi:hypothetical protein [Sorangium sp. So ce381]|uniref:hypothetical protein n=1 Tax=Sorangium sp. So ce381 TaxID=3133307 RepID=UPI003F5C90AD